MEETIRCEIWRHRAPELARALGIADSFLRRWDDGFTAACRDDIGLRAAMLAVERLDSLRDKRHFPAVVRTIARRQRVRLVRQRARNAASLETGELMEEIEQPVLEVERYFVGGAWIARQEMLRVLPEVLDELSSLNSRLLLGLYEGFTCAELAVRFDLSIDSVKTRIYRSRRRVRQIFEAMAQRRASRLHAEESRSPDVPAPTC